MVQTVGGGVLYQTEHTGAVDPANVGQAIQEKIRIAEYCTELVRDHDDILIAPGTTTFLAGKIMSGITDKRFRIITNSLELALETSVAENISTVILGGEVWRKHSVGEKVGFEYFTRCHKQHTLIMSADGFHRDEGITVFETPMVAVLREMISVSDRIVLALDSHKFGRARYHRVGGLENITLVVTDGNAPRDDVEYIREQGVPVVLV